LSFSIFGFRSLTQVLDLPIGAPTILAGHNDGGKTAVLSALEFLVGTYQLTDQDRTYTILDSTDEASATSTRCRTTRVEGLFALDDYEQGLGYSAQIRVRRQDNSDEAGAVLEYLSDQPIDERLRNVESLTVPVLKSLASEFGLKPKNQLRPALLEAVALFASKEPTKAVWTALPKLLAHRLPRLLFFSGEDESPDRAVHTALAECYRTHLRNDDLQGRLQELEAEVTERVQNDAKSLCDHIMDHCPDLVEVSVQPEISFQQGFKRTHLHIARTKGELVDLTRAGRGSSRRIALAIWEWTSNILEENQTTASSGQSSSDGEPPLQTIVVYDEPDTHLDYHHQRTVMDIIRRQCSIENVKVLVATHSMNLIDGVDIADVVHLRLESGRTVAERLADSTHDGIDFHLGQIAAALGLRNTVLLHERCFLAVEGPTEQQSIPVLFRLSQGLSLQAAGVALWACNNNEGALRLASYLVAHRRTVMLMVDADSRGLPGGLFKDDRLRQFGLEPGRQVHFVGEALGYNELEELFTDDQWARAANASWPRVDAREWTTDDFAGVRSERKFSSAVLELIKTDATVSPDGKPDMMFRLAVSLTSANDVPAPLRDAFSQLRALAS